ncbi:hypothetical protein [Virgibacillus halodenitrificans]|uniref:hypothetical protein n=1 Tax=Virgibacillus halodenitrificans TaxID=1482 RepID=UPI000EF46F0F|nr:hypothetical protein [Virgibacillus halodenitrificans]
MNKKQIEKFQEFFGRKRNKERLLNLLKREGEFLEFRENVGFIYAIKIGEAENTDIMLKIAMLNGDLTIFNAFKRPEEGQVKIA